MAVTVCDWLIAWFEALEIWDKVPYPAISKVFCLTWRVVCLLQGQFLRAYQGRLPLWTWF